MRFNVDNKKLHFCSKVKRNNTGHHLWRDAGEQIREIKVAGYTAEPDKLRGMHYVHAGIS